MATNEKCNEISKKDIKKYVQLHWSLEREKELMYCEKFSEFLHKQRDFRNEIDESPDDEPETEEIDD